MLPVWQVSPCHTTSHVVISKFQPGHAFVSMRCLPRHHACLPQPAFSHSHKASSSLLPTMSACLLPFLTSHVILNNASRSLTSALLACTQTGMLAQARPSGHAAAQEAAFLPKLTLSEAATRWAGQGYKPSVTHGGGKAATGTGCLPRVSCRLPEAGWLAVASLSVTVISAFLLRFFKPAAMPRLHGQGRWLQLFFRGLHTCFGKGLSKLSKGAQLKSCSSLLQPAFLLFCTCFLPPSVFLGCLRFPSSPASLP